MNDTQIWPTEPRMYIDENSLPHNEKAERLNGRLAMLGVIAAIGSYAVTGQLIPGFWWEKNIKVLAVVWLPLGAATLKGKKEPT